MLQIKLECCIFFLGHGAKHHFKLYSDSITLVPLKLSYSRRASQQISTHVLRLLLEEVLGYEDIILVPDDSGLSVKKAVQKLTGCSSHKYIFLHQICILVTRKKFLFHTKQ